MFKANEMRWLVPPTGKYKVFSFKFDFLTQNYECLNI